MNKLFQLLSPSKPLTLVGGSFSLVSPTPHKSISECTISDKELFKNASERDSAIAEIIDQLLQNMLSL